MVNRLSRDEVMDALARIGPKAPDVAGRWHRGRREANLQAVLDRTADSGRRQDDPLAAAGGIAPATRATRSRPKLRWVIVPVMVAAVVTAVALVAPSLISSRPIEASPVTTPTPVTTPVTTTSPTARWALAALAPDDMPLVPYFEAIGKAKDWEAAAVDPGDLQKWWDQKETFLAQCMGKEGFEFFPRSYAQPDSSDATEWAARKALRYRDTLPIPALDGDRATVAAIGFGLSGTPETLLNQTASWDAKNSQYVAGLSPQRQDDYEIAMNGQTNDDSRPNPMTNGCYWKAEKGYPEPDATSFNNQIAFKFGDVISGVLSFNGDESIEKDSRVIALNSQWRSCMSRAGFQFESLRAHQTDGAGALDGPHAAIELAVLTGDDGRVANFPAPSDAPVDERSLTGSAPEIKIALADYDCRNEVSYIPRLVEVQRELEQRFVDKHRTRLDELLAYVHKEVSPR